jgi:hypothetical protein
MRPIPFRCIWCLKRAPDVTFNTSHVLPEYVGNVGQQVLPAGIVCAGCNSYFGQKVEPVLLDDPLFHAIAVFLSLVDPEDMNVFRDKIFDSTHQPREPPERDLKLNVDLRQAEFTVDIACTIKGKLTKGYTKRALALLSRAVHKIAFESLAWSVFVEGPEADLDLFSDQFEPVRLWACEGQPYGTVRPVFRKPNPTISRDYSIRCWKFDKAVGIELMLFADWYGVSLTSTADNVLSGLVGWVGPNADDKTWCITEGICAVKKLASD